MDLPLVGGQQGALVRRVDQAGILLAQGVDLVLVADMPLPPRLHALEPWEVLAGAGPARGLLQAALGGILDEVGHVLKTREANHEPERMGTKKIYLPDQKAHESLEDSLLGSVHLPSANMLASHQP